MWLVDSFLQIVMIYDACIINDYKIYFVNIKIIQFHNKNNLKLTDVKWHIYNVEYI
jgi:hypothetical protein